MRSPTDHDSVVMTAKVRPNHGQVKPLNQAFAG
jgi:hypothetical protein